MKRVLSVLSLFVVAGNLVIGQAVSEDNPRLAFVKSFVEKARSVGRLNKESKPGTLDGFEAVKDWVALKSPSDPDPPKSGQPTPVNERLLAIQSFTQDICELERNPNLVTTPLVYRYENDEIDGNVVRVELKFGKRFRVPDGSWASSMLWEVRLHSIKEVHPVTKKEKEAFKVQRVTFMIGPPRLSGLFVI